MLPYHVCVCACMHVYMCACVHPRHFTHTPLVVPAAFGKADWCMSLTLVHRWYDESPKEEVINSHHEVLEGTEGTLEITAPGEAPEPSVTLEAQETYKPITDTDEPTPPTVESPGSDVPDCPTSDSQPESDK